jgi:hypothetical protein
VRGRATGSACQGAHRGPLSCRVVGNRLITLYIVGRKSGRHYTVPVAYTHHDRNPLIGTPSAWGPNLHTGEPVAVRFKGKRVPADVQVLIDEAGVAASALRRPRSTPTCRTP